MAGCLRAAGRSAGSLPAGALASSWQSIARGRHRGRMEQECVPMPSFARRSERRSAVCGQAQSPAPTLSEMTVGQSASDQPESRRLRQTAAWRSSICVVENALGSQAGSCAMSPADATVRVLARAERCSQERTAAGCAAEVLQEANWKGLRQMAGAGSDFLGAYAGRAWPSVLRGRVCRADEARASRKQSSRHIQSG